MLGLFGFPCSVRLRSRVGKIVYSAARELAEAVATLAQTRAELAETRDQIAELEARLRQNPRYSSRPPSS